MYSTAYSFGSLYGFQELVILMVNLVLMSAAMNLTGQNYLNENQYEYLQPDLDRNHKYHLSSQNFNVFTLLI